MAEARGFSRLDGEIMRLFKIRPANQDQQESIGSITEAIHYVRKIIDAEKDRDTNKVWLDITRRAKARDKDAKLLAIGIAENILKEAVLINGLTLTETAYRVYCELWGLSILEDIYADPEVDEIRADRYDFIQIVRLGKPEFPNIKFENDEQLLDLVRRMPMHDNVRISDSHPCVESVLLDGSRLTATKHPLTPQGTTFALRKHGTFKATLESYIKRQTMNERVFNIITLLGKCQCNILVVGPPNTGKTTLIKVTVQKIDKGVRIVSLESDSELKLREYYAGENRSIIEFEEQAGLGLTNKTIFPIILRYSPNMIIFGEIRTAADLEEAINSAIRGHSGCIASVHYLSAKDAMFHMGMMLIQEGRNLTSKQAQLLVARPWDVVVVMFESPIHGIKKVIQICEVMASTIDEDNPYKLVPLVEWVPSEEDYWVGEWTFPNQPSQRLFKKMRMYGLSKFDLEKVGWSWTN